MSAYLPADTGLEIMIPRAPFEVDGIVYDLANVAHPYLQPIFGITNIGATCWRDEEAAGFASHFECGFFHSVTLDYDRVAKDTQEDPIFL